MLAQPQISPPPLPHSAYAVRTLPTAYSPNHCLIVRLRIDAPKTQYHAVCWSTIVHDKCKHKFVYHCNNACDCPALSINRQRGWRMTYVCHTMCTRCTAQGSCLFQHRPRPAPTQRAACTAGCRQPFVWCLSPSKQHKSIPQTMWLAKSAAKDTNNAKPSVGMAVSRQPAAPLLLPHPCTPCAA